MKTYIKINWSFAWSCIHFSQINATNGGFVKNYISNNTKLKYIKTIFCYFAARPDFPNFVQGQLYSIKTFLSFTTLSKKIFRRITESFQLLSYEGCSSPNKCCNGFWGQFHFRTLHLSSAASLAEILWQRNIHGLLRPLKWVVFGESQKHIIYHYIS